MRSNIRSIVSIGLSAVVVGTAGASGSAQGGVDTQVWVLKSGPDVTYYTNPISYVTPGGLTGSGTASGTVTTNMPANGGIYYNTNSGAQVPTDGSASVDSGEGNYYYFSNLGATAQTVELQWQGFITSTSTAAGNGQAMDSSWSFLFDSETNVYVEDLVYTTVAGPGEETYSQFASGDYTFTLAPLQLNYWIEALAYNEASVISPGTPEPAPIVALGFGVLPLLGLRWRNRKTSASR